MTMIFKCHGNNTILVQLQIFGDKNDKEKHSSSFIMKNIVDFYVFSFTLNQMYLSANSSNVLPMNDNS